MKRANDLLERADHLASLLLAQGFPSSILLIAPREPCQLDAESCLSARQQSLWRAHSHGSTEYLATRVMKAS